MFFRESNNGVAASLLAGAILVGVAAPAAAFDLFGYSQASASVSSASRNHASGHFDGGGNVFSYYGRAHAAGYSSHRTVISGVCASACTMKLGIRNACVERDATLMFHQASYDGRRSELATRMMLYSYPSRIRQWVLRSGALNSSSLTTLSGSQAIALGMRPC
jgi:hypothetical protein